MIRMKCLLICLCTIATGPPGTTGKPSPAQADSGQFLVISDIHFNTFFDGSLFPELAARPSREWPEILRRSRPAGVSPRGSDSNYALLVSSLDDAKARAPDPDFILYPGDFLAHEWQKKYDALATRSHTADPAPYRAFTRKTLELIARELQSRWPETPILPTLGNDDSLCGDYMITPDGPFLEMFRDVWEPLIGTDADQQSFRATFGQTGAYTLPLTRMNNHRLLVVNSVFFSTSYDNACGTGGQTPALNQLRWLDEAVARADLQGEKVWLLMHIPPGINSFNTAESVKDGGPAVTFWQDALTSGFLNLLERHADTIEACFVGHTHMDDFRAIGILGRPTLFAKIAPAISPIYGNNPGYQVFQYDRRAGTVHNYQTYFLADPATAPGKSPGSSWALEYDFRTAYDLPALDASSIARLAARMQADARIQQLYTRFYAVSAPPEITPQTLGVYRCAISNTTPAEFLTCYQGTSRPKNPHPHPDRRISTEAARR
jgi:hypothetical protein